MRNVLLMWASRYVQGLSNGDFDSPVGTTEVTDDHEAATFGYGVEPMGDCPLPWLYNWTWGWSVSTSSV